MNGSVEINKTFSSRECRHNKSNHVGTTKYTVEKVEMV